MTEDSLATDDGPVPFDTTVPNVARIYDFLLQGKDNFAADREAAGKLLEVVPEAASAARDNRLFLNRAVDFLAREAGIRQFLDIGTGLPTGGSVHERAQETDPLCHVVYADNDPIVVSHANALLADYLRVAAVQADLRNPDHLLTLPTVRALIDFEQPVAVLMVAVPASSERILCSWSRQRAVPQVAGVPALAVTCGYRRMSGSRTRARGRCVFLRRVSPASRKISLC